MIIHNEEQMLVHGRRLASFCQPPLVIYLKGPLGGGKTSFSRGFLQGLGYEGKVKSPTYTLVEPYLLKDLSLYHFDLYRIQDPEELELIGLRDYFHSEAMVLIEWPELAHGLLPPPDITFEFKIILEGRELILNAGSPRGHKVLEEFCNK